MTLYYSAGSREHTLSVRHLGVCEVDEHAEATLISEDLHVFVVRKLIEGVLAEGVWALFALSLGAVEAETRGVPGRLLRPVAHLRAPVVVRFHVLI